MQTGEASEVVDAPGWLAGRVLIRPTAQWGLVETLMLETKSGRRAGMEVTEA